MRKLILLALTFVIAGPCLHLLLAADKAPTFGDLASLESSVPLGPKQEDVIRKYIRHWVGQLKAAKNFEQVKLARDKLQGSFHAQAAAYYQLSYAKIAAKEVAVLLSSPDKLKQIHAAMAMAWMPRYTIQPGLEKMAASKNPAVRYWAVHGYRRACTEMMLHEQRAKTMLTTLGKLGLAEPVSATVGGVFRALRPYGEIKPAKLAALRGTLSKVWLARCRDLSQARPGFIEAYRDEVGALGPLDKKGDTKAVLQLLADVMEAASLAFDSKAGKSDRAVQVSLFELLIDAEARLGRILGMDDRPVRTILRNKELAPAARIADAADAIKDTWMEVLAEKWKIKPRPIPRPPVNPATRPTTMAAGAG